MEISPTSELQAWLAHNLLSTSQAAAYLGTAKPNVVHYQRTNKLPVFLKRRNSNLFLLPDLETFKYGLPSTLPFKRDSLQAWFSQNLVDMRQVSELLGVSRMMVFFSMEKGHLKPFLTNPVLLFLKTQITEYQNKRFEIQNPPGGPR